MPCEVWGTWSGQTSGARRLPGRVSGSFSSRLPPLLHPLTPPTPARAVASRLKMTVFSYSFLSSDNSDLSCNRNVSVLLTLLLSFFQFTPFPKAVLKKLRNEREGYGNRKKHIYPLLCRKEQRRGMEFSTFQYLGINYFL